MRKYTCIPAICRNCKCDFMARKSSIKIGNGLYCSKSCARTGKPSKKRKDQRKRFYTLFEKTDSCWVWTGKCTNFGYGQFKDMRTGKTVSAHRFSYEIHIGKIPIKMLVLHKCDNPSCVNPSHLFLGNHKTNSQDASNKKRLAHGEKHPKTKLSEEDIFFIRYNYPNISGPKLAIKFNVVRQTIYNIVKKHTWTNV